MRPEDEQVVSLRWAKYASKCLDVSHQKLTGHPGMLLQLWDCPADPHLRDMFIIPRPGRYAMIRPHTYPELCLETSNGFTMQFQLCSSTPQAQMLFTIRSGGVEGYHHVHMAANMAKCLDIPNDNSTNGNEVQLWSCQVDYTRKNAHTDQSFTGVDYMGATRAMPSISWSDRVGDENLLIEPSPVDCKWGQWSTWTGCSRQCGSGHNGRFRHVARNPGFSGLECDGNWHQVTDCLVKNCTIAGPKEIIENSIVPTMFAFFLGLCCLPLMFWFARRWRKAAKVVEAHRQKESDESTLLLFDQLKQSENLRWQEEEAERLRDEEGWQRIQTERQQREIISNNRKFKSGGVQTAAVTCPERHELHPSTNTRRKWACDGRKKPGGCKNKLDVRGFHKFARFSCEACNYDLCSDCYTDTQMANVPKESKAPQPGGTRFRPISPGGIYAETAGTALSPATRRWTPQVNSRDRQRSPSPAFGL